MNEELTSFDTANEASFIDVAYKFGPDYALAGGDNKALFLQGFFEIDAALKISSVSGNAFKLNSFNA